MLTHIFKYKDQEINNYSYFEVNKRILTENRARYSYSKINPYGYSAWIRICPSYYLLFVSEKIQHIGASL